MGYHQYDLTHEPRILFVSENLCEMIGYGKQQLENGTGDCYFPLVHPADRVQYQAFLKKCAEQIGTNKAEYRLLKKDGTVLWVSDTVTSLRGEDGTVLASSVLSDISETKAANNNLQFLNETIPCGFMKYTCEKQPRITYMNQTMIDLLRFPKCREGEVDYLEMYKENIFLMIPMEERRRFSKYLNRVFSADAPVAGEMSMLRLDGTRAYVFGWVTKTVNEQGVEEFQSVCMDITERHRSRKSAEAKRYLKALTDVYDKIFEFQLDADTVKCLHAGEDSSFKQFEDIAVRIEDALEKWLIRAVAPENTEEVRKFFLDFCQNRLYEPGAKPPQLCYHAKGADGTVNRYLGIFIRIDETTSYYCCRRVQETGEAEALRTENDQLKENMKELVQRFSDGIAAFELTATGLVKPLYASENVWEFFGYTQEEWLPLTNTYTPIESFVAYSESGMEDFDELLRNGEAEFGYFDYSTETERRIKAVCSQKEPNSNAPRYVMLYKVEKSTEEKAELSENRTVMIRTFGYFDVFVGEKPIAFRNKKSKELFALLVDRKGGYVTSEEAITFLWEDEPVNPVTLSRYRKVALRLKNTLEEYGITDVMETVDGKRRIVMERVQCDLYQYLSGDRDYAQLFKGSYLTNYSWGEYTLGELTGV